jgi:DNA-binding IclR family transcriptional regulator
MGRESVQSLERALSILVVLGRHEEPLGVTRLGNELQLAKSTVHRLLATLEPSGFVTRTPQGRYGLGLRLFELGCVAVRNLGLREAARPVMQRLALQTAETVNLAVWDHAEAVFIEKVEGCAPARLLARIGGRAPAHASSCGLVLLAHQRPEVQERACRSLRRFTDKTITDVQELRRRLEEIRRQGYAFSTGAWHPEGAALAAPVRSRGGEVVGSLAVAAPPQRLARRVAEVSRLVRAAAEEISRAVSENATADGPR